MDNTAARYCHCGLKLKDGEVAGGKVCPHAQLFADMINAARRARLAQETK